MNDDAATAVLARINALSIEDRHRFMGWLVSTDPKFVSDVLDRMLAFQPPGGRS